MLVALVLSVSLVGCAPSAVRSTLAGILAPTSTAADTATLTMTATQIRPTVEPALVPTEKPMVGIPKATLPACTKPDRYRQEDGLEFAFGITDAIGDVFFLVKFDAEASRIFVKAGLADDQYTDEYSVDFCEEDEYDCLHSAVLTLDETPRATMKYKVCGESVYTEFSIFN